MCRDQSLPIVECRAQLELYVPSTFHFTARMHNCPYIAKCAVFVESSYTLGGFKFSSTSTFNMDLLDFTKDCYENPSGKIWGKFYSFQGLVVILIKTFIFFNTSATTLLYLVIHIANDEILMEFPLCHNYTCAIPSVLSMWWYGGNVRVFHGEQIWQICQIW